MAVFPLAIQRVFEKIFPLVLSHFTLYKIGLDNVHSINDCTESLFWYALETGGQPLIIYGCNDCNFAECSAEVKFTMAC